MKRIVFSSLFLIIAVAAFFACNNDDFGKLRENELIKLDEFIRNNYPDVDSKPSGLYYIETKSGVGDSVKAGDIVQIFYSTWTIDSVLIDETNGYSLGHRFEPFEYTVGAGSAISGLEEASQFMKPGTCANLVLPSELAYGQNGTTGVAGFTTLLMEVEVYKVYPVNAGQ